MKEPVALFVPTLGGGGAERAMVEIARGLAARELSVDLVLIRAEGPYMEQVPPSVRVVDLHARRAVTSLLKLVRYLRARRPSVLLATLPGSSVVGMVARYVAMVPLAVINRRASTLTMEFRNARFKARLNLRLEKLLLPTAAAVVVSSRDAATDLLEHVAVTSERLHVIHNPIVSAELRRQAALPVEHPWFGSERPPVVLCAGRLVPLKDHRTLLRAFAKVAELRTSHLVVLGEGPERDGLARLADELGIRHAVDFAGFKLNPFAYMSKARVFVLPSLYEGSPNVLVQAMACGTPVVSTDCPSGPREILEDGKWGTLVPVGNSVALADAIVEALDNPVEPGALVARANNYSAESSIDAYLDLITRVAQSNSYRSSSSDGR